MLYNLGLFCFIDSDSTNPPKKKNLKIIDNVYVGICGLNQVHFFYWSHKYMLKIYILMIILKLSGIQKRLKEDEKFDIRY